MDHEDQNPLRLFSNRNYALYFAGQLVSQVGTWMQQIALSWLAFRLTGSAFLLSVVGVSGQLPSLLVMPYAGALADRFNRHRIIILTQICGMIQAGLLAYLTLTNQVEVWHLIGLGLFLGLVNAFDIPVRSAFVVNMLEKKEDLPAAIAMNSSLMNISRLLGPALAGFIVASLGEGSCFLINALSYIAVIAALLVIRGKFDPEPREIKQSTLKEIKEGLRYALGNAPVRASILFLAIFGFGGMAYAVLLPVLVKDIGGDANTLGYLSAASAFGSVIGSVFLAMRKSVIGMGRIALVSSFVYSIVLFAFGFVHDFWIALPVLALLGGAFMLQMGCLNTILQSVVDENKRGRVMSLFAMAFMGSIPLGSLVGGAIASRYGFQTMVFVSSAYCITVCIIFARLIPRLRRQTRPIYIQRGLLDAEEEIDLLTKPGG
ncbi:MAG: MFS transporter [Candidatus Obscuribacterales bacterium]